MTSAVTRRRFLTGAAAATVVGFAAGCGSDGGDATAGSTSTTTPTTRHTARLPSDPFTLGVASGDPLADAVVLWTRLAPDPLAPDGLGAMPSDPVDVEWEVATDDRFTSVVRSGVVTASPDDAHAVHVDVDGLDPAADLRYRFRVGEFTSPVGRTKTLPDGSPRRFGLAVANCQWLETGTYAAYRHMLAEPIDLVVHLGDYIYEYAGVEGPRMAQPAHTVVSLADYRLRYASYKRDPDLLAVHARFPFVVTWDDHEVANNYVGDDAGTERTAAAYRAWWEHQPVRLPPPDGAELVIDRSLDVGDLARLYVLDQRQFSDPVPCRGSATAADDYGDCPERTDERTQLGSGQEERFAEAAGRGGVTWNLIGNPVVLAGVDGGSDSSQFYLDTWDGFPTARLRFIEQLAAIDNPVVLTGDYHAGMVLDVHERPFQPETPVVAPEFMAPPISSPLFPADVRARTPHLRQQLNGHGYLTVAVEPEQLTATFCVLDDVGRADSGMDVAATWQVAAGSPVAEQV
jgi:alkaline phosphatase D